MLKWLKAITSWNPRVVNLCNPAPHQETMFTKELPGPALQIIPIICHILRSRLRIPPLGKALQHSFPSLNHLATSCQGEATWSKAETHKSSRFPWFPLQGLQGTPNQHINSTWKWYEFCWVIFLKHPARFFASRKYTQVHHSSKTVEDEAAA